MKRLAICIAFLSSMLCFSISSFSLELMSNESLDKISGRAVSVQQNDSSEVFFPFDLFESNEPELTSYSQADNDEFNNTVIMDFFGFYTTDEFDNIYYQNFYSEFSAQNISYRQSFNGLPAGSEPYGDIRDSFATDVYSFVVFQGSTIGMTFVPEYFDNNPELTSKALKISNSRIDLPPGLTGKYMCSYQGNLFYAEDLSDLDESFLIYPNRQTITTGTARDSDLTFLLPEGEGDDTVWRPVVTDTDPRTGEQEYLVIPEGEKYIHISVNSSVTRMSMNFKVGLSSVPRSSYSQNDEFKNFQPLGTLMMSGSTSMNSGSVIITTSDTL